MARTKPELRPRGIASGPLTASGHLNPCEFASDPPNHTIGKFRPYSTATVEEHLHSMAYILQRIGPRFRVSPQRTGYEQRVRLMFACCTDRPVRSVSKPS